MTNTHDFLPFDLMNVTRYGIVNDLEACVTFRSVIMVDIFVT